MNSTRLHCFVDLSGSMAEYGKPMLLINLLRYVRQYSDQHKLDVSCLGWQESIHSIEWFVGHDVQLPTAEHHCDVTALIDWIGANPSETSIVLTDGYFDVDASQRHQLAQFGRLYLIAVGGDADLAKLRTISKRCYLGEQLDQLLHELLRPEASGSGPSRRVDLFVPTVDDEQDDDEW